MFLQQEKMNDRSLEDEPYIMYALIVGRLFSYNTMEFKKKIW